MRALLELRTVDMDERDVDAEDAELLAPVELLPTDERDADADADDEEADADAELLPCEVEPLECDDEVRVLVEAEDETETGTTDDAELLREAELLAALELACEEEVEVEAGCEDELVTVMGVQSMPTSPSRFPQHFAGVPIKQVSPRAAMHSVPMFAPQLLSGTPSPLTRLEAAEPLVAVRPTQQKVCLSSHWKGFDEGVARLAPVRRQGGRGGRPRARRLALVSRGNASTEMEKERKARRIAVFMVVVSSSQALKR
ncbi:hypothetical protein B0H17DRAFT_1047382 [Mycena rosella]|uniref:Uncharacterized protein n=1 Tax=Mycena rosella TaxID=1033263 RepID=A0AAD7DW82_MYCRO|nr:hypothetical protein B0H17DRAFT_1047382 [Mycena rosella]